MSIISISLATQPDSLAWDAYVEAHRDGLAYHRWAWKEAVERAYGFEGLYLIAKRGGQVCGVLPTVHHKVPFTGGKLVSLPYCDVGGVLADDGEVADALIVEALRWAKRRGAKALELRSATSHGVPLTAVNDSRLTIHDSPLPTPHFPLPTPRSPLTGFKVRMLLALPDSSDALMQGFKSKHRSQVRKPIRDGLKARLGGAEEVDTFYAVFAENMRDLGSPVHSRRWIREVVEAFGEHARIGVVALPDGTPAAAGMILMNGNTVSIPWASSLRQYNRQNPNMLLYWTFLEWAADNGFEIFDFGRSTKGEGTYRFKGQWGAKPTELAWATLGVDGDIQPEQSRINAGGLRSRVETAWRQLPQGICNTLGPMLRRYVSL